VGGGGRRRGARSRAWQGQGRRSGSDSRARSGDGRRERLFSGDQAGRGPQRCSERARAPAAAPKVEGLSAGRPRVNEDRRAPGAIRAVQSADHRQLPLTGRRIERRETGAEKPPRAQRGASVAAATSRWSLTSGAAQTGLTRKRISLHFAKLPRLAAQISAEPPPHRAPHRPFPFARRPDRQGTRPPRQRLSNHPLADLACLQGIVEA